ncbi:hypothetical protein ACKWTF_016589 [Chironomus riparius]
MWLINIIIAKMEMKEIFVGAFLNLCWCGVTVYIVCCCLILFTTRLRLFMINKILKRILTRAEIKTISKLHMNICEMASMISKVFSFQMAVMTGMSILNGTLCIFELYIAIRDHTGGLDLYFSIMATTTCCFFTLVVAFIMGTSSYTTSEGENTLAVLHVEIYRKPQVYDKRRIQKFQIILLQLQHFNVNVSCGFYRLDWKVMMMVKET